MIDTKNSSGQQVYSLANGFPYSHHPYGAQYARPDGPLLLQDIHLVESLAHFDRERIPERVVHAKGGGCRFEFELTDSLSDITFAAPYQKPGYKCPGVVRFSTVGGEQGTPDTQRDPRGFSLKFYTEWGNHDWVFNNTPVFFIRDANKFPHFIHTQKRDPRSHLNHGADSTMYWDYLTQNPESIHQITYMFGDRGTPANWANMSGYSGHTYKFRNDKGELTYVQIHVRPDGGFKCLNNEQAAELGGSSPDFNQQTLFKQLEAGERPSYTCYVQTMTLKQAEEFRYSINDLTKIWPHKEFPLRKFGKITLTQNVDNYFEEIEQIAFSPSNTCIPGIEPSNDSVLQSRLFSYPDTQRHRLGANYQQLPVNSPRNMCPVAAGNSGCPFLAGNFQRDGPGALYNQNSYPNYISTQYKEKIQYKDLTSANVSKDTFVGVVPKNVSDAGVKTQEEVRQHEEIINAKINEYYWVTGASPLDFEQPRALYEKVFDDKHRERFIHNVVGHVSTASSEIQARVPQYFALLNEDLGAAIAKGLGVKYEPLSFEEYAKRLSLASSY